MPLGLDICCNINSDPLASIKRLLSVPRCCVLPEDMVSGLAMHGKPVALSRGATNIQLKPESKLILLPFSISLLKAPLTKLLGGIVPWYVTPPLVQLVFVLVLYSLQICAA